MSGYQEDFRKAYLAGERAIRRTFRDVAIGVTALPCGTTNHYVEFELWCEDGPLEFERYAVVLPDGATRTGKLDVDGFARIDDVAAAGMCRVSFPDFDDLELGEADVFTPGEKRDPAFLVYENASERQVATDQCHLFLVNLWEIVDLDIRLDIVEMPAILPSQAETDDDDWELVSISLAYADDARVASDEDEP